MIQIRSPMNHSQAQWPRAAVVMAYIGWNPVASVLLRRARRLATALSGTLLAVHIDYHSSAPGYQIMRDMQLELARELGARVLVVEGQNIAETLVAVARQQGVTHLIIGELAACSRTSPLGGMLLQQILRRAIDIDVYVVADRI